MKVDPTTGLPILNQYELDARQEFLDALALVAKWLVEHPNMPAPSLVSINHMNVTCNGVENLAAVRRAGGFTEKYADDHWVGFKQKVGPITLDIFDSRHSVCERVKVGEEVQPAMPERVVEKFEWKCPSILESSVS